MAMTLRPWLRLSAATACATLLSACGPSRPTLHSAAGLAQGTTYSLQWTGGPADVDEIEQAAGAELDRLDALLSNYRSDSTIEKFNAARTVEPQQLPAELVGLLRLAKDIHAASHGCFDPTVRPLVHLWGFDGDTPSVPEPAAVAQVMAEVGLDNLEIIDEEHVRKTVPELAIDMSSIGQGYSAERLGRVLEGHGIQNYLAEIGGEIFARGTKPGGQPWRVGVEDPGGDTAGALRLPAQPGTAVMTSGTYRHYFEAGGRRYSHIIDPRTGAPVDHALLEVTVIAHDGAKAGAWGTALLCLGPEVAAAVAEQERVAALFAVRSGEDAVERRRSPAIARDWPGLLH
ncbi:MAG TPA: FAD:protein FMN transferase [Gammaproteobacteria bacterium]|nr:FAD:protein FMN transferase [Gammaproteobacteria bacterium]